MTKTAAAVRVSGIVAGTVLGLYALTVVAVWGVAGIVDLRHDVARPEAP